MTTQNTETDDLENEKTEEAVKPMPMPKVSKFGNAGFQNGSKFGKWVSGNVNPQLKQRPGRAAARGR